MNTNRLNRHPNSQPMLRNTIGPLRNTVGPLVKVLAIAFLVGLIVIATHNRPVGASSPTIRYVSPSGNDMSDTNTCAEPGNPCATIQNAVNQSNSGDTIQLAGGTYKENVSITKAQTDPLFALTIQGSAGSPGSVVDGQAAGSVFTIANALLSMLTITNGNAREGGGIFFVSGNLTVSQCTINANVATNNPFGASDGGALFVDNNSVTVINSTITGNSARDDGGSVFVDQSSVATFVNCTISDNSSSVGGGIYVAPVATVNLTNTIIAGNSGGDFVSSGTLGTNDHNLVLDGSVSGALTADPMLGPLQNNGGPTATMALLPESPAIDAGDDSVLGSPFNLATDQRGTGFPRRLGAHVDIGAYEFGSCPAVTLNPISKSITGGPVTFTAGASGDPVPSVQWQVSTNGGTSFTNIPGATSPTYTFTPTPSQSGYEYRAVFSTTGCGAATTTAATLTVFNVCLKDNTTGNLLQWSSVTGQYVFTQCATATTLTGTGTVALVNGMETLTDSKSTRRLSAAFATGQLTGTATIYMEVATGIWQTFQITDTNPHATCSCSE